jgi:hypothetical protein
MPAFVFIYRMPMDYVPGKTPSTCRRGSGSWSIPGSRKERSSGGTTSAATGSLVPACLSRDLSQASRHSARAPLEARGKGAGPRGPTQRSWRGSEARDEPVAI